MSIGSLIDQVAAELNDYAPGNSFKVWTRDQIRAYLGEGLTIVYGQRPDLFIEDRVLELEPCSLVQDVCDCDSIRRVIGQSDAQGRVFNEIRRTSYNSTLRWPGKRCSVDVDNFKLDSYSIDYKTSRLRVYPAVPVGVKVYVLVECSTAPSDFSDGAQYEGDLEAAAVQWALWKAKAIDSEINQGIFTIAREHRTAFWELVKAQVAAEILTEKDSDDAD